VFDYLSTTRRIIEKTAIVWKIAEHDKRYNDSKYSMSGESEEGSVLGS